MSTDRLTVRTRFVPTFLSAPRRQRLSWPAAIAGLLIAAHATPAAAALRQWSGAGGIPDWSNPGNWSGGVVPVDGDELLFGAFSLDLLHRTTRDDVSPLNLDLIAFTADAAPYSINVFDELTISGVGILNASASTHTMLIGNTTFGECLVSFAGTATASNLRIEIEGALLTSPPGGMSFNIPGHLRFLDTSTAASATIVNGGAGFAGGSSEFFDGGLTEFMNSSTAAGSSITNSGGTSVRASGGLTRFTDTATAGNATIANNGGTADGSGGGTIEFVGSSTAATARITNNAGNAGGPGGVTEFRSSATAADAAITNVGGTNNSLDGYGSTAFTTRSTAGRATITNHAGTASGAEGGLTAFSRTAVAGTATIRNHAGTAVGAQGGLTTFGGITVAGAPNGEICSADGATITNDGGSVPNLSGVFAGRTSFRFNSTAGNATIINSGGSVNLGIGGRTDFDGSTTAGAANITNKAGLISGARGGWTAFAAGSTAGNATITNEAAAVVGASPGFTSFVNARTLAATLINRGSAVSGANAGRTDFSGTSIAGTPTITNDAGTANGARGGRTIFRESATAGGANIVNNGAAVIGAESGATEFSGTASAGNSTITTNAGAAGAAGGLALFLGGADGGTARAITNGSGRFDISGLTTTGMAIGSIEGTGNYLLGGKNLAVGGNALSTTVSGALQDGGATGGVAGSLTKVGAGTLTLSGVNSYTGATIINGGALLVNGSIASSPTQINDGGTLGGSGVVGALDIADGGTVSPGASPGRLTASAATFQSGGNYLLELASDGTGTPGVNWDQLAVEHAVDVSLLNPADPFVLSLRTLDGANAGNPLAAWDPGIDHTWASVMTTNDGFGGAFDASHFRIDTAGFLNPFHGTFAVLLNGADLDLHYSSIPEPATSTLLLGCGAALLGASKKRQDTKRPRRQDDYESTKRAKA